MGLFGKRKEDEYIDLASEPPAPALQPDLPKEKPKKEGFGIDQLVQLMRRLPNDNIELVVRVLKETLESVSIAVTRLIKDAEKREAELSGSVDTHKKAIASLEDELATRKKAIEDEISKKKKAIEELETAHREVSLVKDRLQLSLTLDQDTSLPEKKAPPPVPDARSKPPPPPVDSNLPAKVSPPKPPPA